MSLSTILIYVGIAAIILTLITVYALKTKKTWLATFLQNYVGAFFIFSGWVKAVDPLGTAYKMEQYFAEFEATFEATWFSFLSPLFPFLSGYAVQFAVFMIVFEIILGVMLIIGSKPKFTSWAFLILVGFFTFLTGFTYLTGYVPNGENFFDFGSWAAYNKNNMRVTDCGCFGDFIKLEPKVSFFKDLVLLVPAVFFIYKNRDFHTWFTPRVRTGILAATLIGTLLYCMSNYVTDIPHMDFRDFKIGKDIASQKQAETDAQASVQVLGFQLENTGSGEIKEVGYSDYLANLASYPSDTWKVKDQILGEPSIPLTKISDFDISTIDGHPATDDILSRKGPYFMLVCYKLSGTGNKATRVVEENVYAMDTIYNDTYENGYIVEKNIARVDKRTEEYTNYIWKEHYAKRFSEVVKPFSEAAKKDGIQTVAVIGGADQNMIEDFATDLELDIEYFTADDILLKTIVRSNPGIVLWEDGKIIQKWHYKQLPSYSEVKKFTYKIKVSSVFANNTYLRTCYKDDLILMLSRRSVRIKAMQFLFSISRDGELNFDEASKRYWKSIEITFELYIYNLYVLIAVTQRAQDDQKNRIEKYLPTDFDKKFTDKLFTNPLITSLVDNNPLQKEFLERNFVANTNAEYISKIYNSFSKTEEYFKYIDGDTTPKEDLEVLLELYRHCRKDELFNELMEDAYPQWIDDKSVVIGSVKKSLKDLPAPSTDFYQKFYPDDETVKAYGYELFSITHNEDAKLLETIIPILQNWDHERVAIIDMILLKMALAEFLYFETIPTTVTLNEYLEVSKMYSTAKSKDFINGILDRLKNDLIEKDLIKKKTKES